jgi:tetratricopeptide (TPR) repeat protein
MHLLRKLLLMAFCLSVMSSCFCVTSFAEPSKKVASSSPLTQQEQALEAYNQGLELFQAAQKEEQKGELYNRRRLLGQSQKLLAKALHLAPHFVEAQSNLAYTYVAEKKYPKAIDAFKAALKLQPTHLNSLNGLATTYALNQQTALALSTFDELLKLAPGKAQFWFNKGSVLQLAKQMDEAKIAYTEALRLEPAYQQCWFNLGTLYENAGERSAAQQAYNKARQVAIDTPIGLEALRRFELLSQP